MRQEPWNDMNRNNLKHETYILQILLVVHNYKILQDY
jgi:hypothetical protein